MPCRRLLLPVRPQRTRHLLQHPPQRSAAKAPPAPTTCPAATTASTATAAATTPRSASAATGSCARTPKSAVPGVAMEREAACPARDTRVALGRYARTAIRLAAFHE
ncbi:unnamed protein product [Sphagnum tenellum]